MDYRSEGDTRLTIDGSRHYKTPYGALPSVTTILSATSGNKAALERWAKKNPGGREAAAARGTKVHALMENFLLGSDREPEIEDEEILLPGSYYYITAIHELGHALGLDHPFEENKFPGVNDTYDLGDNGFNAQPYTFMTYNDTNAGNGYVPTSSSATSGFLETLGAFDIAAIQYLYGPNINSNTGDTIWYLDEDERNGWYCIWDNGGNDTITGGVGGDYIKPGAGNDTIDGGEDGKDIWSGEAVFDRVIFDGLSLIHI